MSGKNIAYIRASSESQNTDRQLDGLEFDRIYEDKASGKNTDRPALKEAIQFLREDDVLHVHSIDRLARNLGDLEEIVQDLTSKGVTVHFHKENLVFSGQKEDPMQRLLFQLLGAVSQFERSLIRERQAEGIKAAMKRGQRFGRPELLSENQKAEIRSKAVFGESKVGLAEEYGVSRQLIYCVLKQGTVNTEAAANG